MKLYRSRNGIFIQHADRFFLLDGVSWDDLMTREDLREFLEQRLRDSEPANSSAPQELLPPIGSQEVWAAGVTYYRSRDARMEESKSAGGGDFYDRVYSRDATGVVLQGDAAPRSRTGRQGCDPRRCQVVGARTGVGAVHHAWRKHRGLHRRQRHELARYRRARIRSIFRKPKSTTAVVRSGRAS